jgi:maleylpyruvate isomerase
MRIREVWLHAVDLDAGADVADVPDGVVDLLLDEVTATLSATDGCPTVELAPTDRDRGYRLGGGPATDPVPVDGPAPVVAAPAAALVGWLTGRTTLPGAPEPPRWL